VRLAISRNISIRSLTHSFMYALFTEIHFTMHLPGTSTKVMIGILKASKKRTKRAALIEESMSKQPARCAGLFAADKCDIVKMSIYCRIDD
jgi:tmRNA-binding protein